MVLGTACGEGGGVCGTSRNKLQVLLDAQETVTTSSPFLDNGYVWPDLFEEVDAMLNKSLLIFPFAQIRAYAKDQKTKGTISPTLGCVLDLPLPADNLFKVLQNDEIRTDLESFILETSEEEVPEHSLAIITQAAERHSMIQQAGTPSASTLEFFDEDTSGSSLLYGIVVDPVAKRVEVVFRGSVVDKEMKVNLGGDFKPCPSPRESQSVNRRHKKQIYLHAGLHDFLFEGGGYRLGSKSKFQQIIEHLTTIFKQDKYTDFKLYVTGHSIGGALASLFAFMVAADPPCDIPLPVTCISFGSPRVGDKAFRDEFQVLEQLGKLRYLRVTNKLDSFARLPCARGFIGFGRRYKHVGMHLVLNDEDDDDTFEIDFPKFDDDFFDECRRSLKNNFLGLFYKFEHHSTDRYGTRLTRSKEILQRLKLNDLYGNVDIVGNNKFAKDEEIRRLTASVTKLRGQVAELEKQLGKADEGSVDSSGHKSVGSGAE